MIRKHILDSGIIHHELVRAVIVLWNNPGQTGLPRGSIGGNRFSMYLKASTARFCERLCAASWGFSPQHYFSDQRYGLSVSGLKSDAWRILQLLSCA